MTRIAGCDLFLISTARAVTQLVITRENEPEVWRDLYGVTVPEDIPPNSQFRWHVQKQIVHPEGDFKSGIAWLCGTELRDGEKVIDYLNPLGRIGSNIIPADHYHSDHESGTWYNAAVVKAGWRIAYRGRLRSYTVEPKGNRYCQIYDNGGISVEITFPP